MSNKFDDKLAWFTDTATATLKIKYDGTKNSNTINQVSKIAAGKLDVNMYLDDNEAVKDFVYDGEVNWDKQFEFNLKISNEGTLVLKYKTTFKISNFDVDKLKKYLYVKVYDENNNLISEGNELNIDDDKNILKPGEIHIYKVIIMLKV